MRLPRESDEGRTEGNTRIMSGQKDGELILSGSNQEVGGNQERTSWKPIGRFHIMNPAATCKVGSIISPSEMGKLRLQESKTHNLAAGQWGSWDLNQGLSKLQNPISCFYIMFSNTGLGTSRCSINVCWVDTVSNKKC